MSLTASIKDLMLTLKNQYQIKYFIEGGTFQGATASWAASHFEDVITIEKSKALYQETSSLLKHIPNIVFQNDDTRTVFRTLTTTQKKSAVFWLDAHWSGSVTVGEEDECPLLDEIKILLEGEAYPFIFIDDARLFLAPPPSPHKVEQWPTIDQVTKALSASEQPCYIVVVKDVIIAVPSSAKPIVVDYCVNIDTVYPQPQANLPFRGLVGAFYKLAHRTVVK